MPWFLLSREFFVFSSRHLVALVLVASLIASDAMTFWHVGHCENACETTCESAHADHASCSHIGNPFLKRRQQDADAIAQTETTDVTDLALPCESKHDSDECSFCRWLVTARDPVVLPNATTSVDLVVFPAFVGRDWTEPASKPLLQDVSRRGPPAPRFFA